jgi:23S rRNA (uracil1939-C5)-methyltransferase
MPEAGAGRVALDASAGRGRAAGDASAATVRLRVEKLVAGGDGLAFLGGKAVFVPFALPGEEVLAAVEDSRRDFSRARLLEVLEPSPRRAAPACPIYGQCGGCNLQHLAYEGQVEQKSLIVADSFSRNARIDLGPVGAVGSAPLGYRNRVQLHFTPEGRVGFMRRSSSELVEARTCPVAVDPIRSWIERRAGEVPAPEGPGGRAIAFGYGNEVWLEGRDDLVSVVVAGRPLRFRVGGFFQSNLGMLDRLVPDSLAGLSGKRAADLYCGVGLFASFLSSSFESLVCVEEDPRSIELAKENLGAGKREFHALPVEDWTRSESAARGFDLVVADPPRTGLSPAVRAWLARAAVPALVYVSCDPVTLARDSGELVRAGYALEGVTAYDFYPQTSHVECVARFSHA